MSWITNTKCWNNTSAFQAVRQHMERKLSNAGKHYVAHSLKPLNISWAGSVLEPLAHRNLAKAVPYSLAPLVQSLRCHELHLLGRWTQKKLFCFGKRTVGCPLWGFGWQPRDAQPAWRSFPWTPGVRMKKFYTWHWLWQLCLNANHMATAGGPMDHPSTRGKLLATTNYNKVEATKFMSTDEKQAYEVIKLMSAAAIAAPSGQSWGEAAASEKATLKHSPGWRNTLRFKIAACTFVDSSEHVCVCVFRWSPLLEPKLSCAAGVSSSSLNRWHTKDDLSSSRPSPFPQEATPCMEKGIHRKSLHSLHWHENKHWKPIMSLELTRKKGWEDLAREAQCESIASLQVPSNMKLWDIWEDWRIRRQVITDAALDHLLAERVLLDLRLLNAKWLMHHTIAWGSHIGNRSAQPQAIHYSEKSGNCIVQM